MNPNVKADDSLNTIMSGLQIYSNVKSFQAKNANNNTSSSMPTSTSTNIDSSTKNPGNYSSAMQRRMEMLEGGF